MSVCALLVVAMIGEMFEEGTLLNPKGELENIVDGLCSIVDQIALSGAEGTATWQVPFASGGEPIMIWLDGTLMRAESGAYREVVQPAIKVRTWMYDGCPMNASQLAGLDDNCPVLEAGSGRSIDLESRLVTLDNQNRLFVFATTST
jgi:hypothetical protein